MHSVELRTCSIVHPLCADTGELENNEVFSFENLA